jgi:hypothetical protein
MNESVQISEHIIEIGVTQELADLEVLNRWVCRNSKIRLLNLVLGIVAGFAGAMITGRLYPHADLTPSFALLYVTLIVYIALRFAFKNIIYRKYYGDNSYSLGSRQYVFSSKGLQFKTLETENFTKWSGIGRIEKTKAHILIFLAGNTAAFIVPFRTLPASWNPDSFVKQLETWRSQYKAA